MAQAAPPAARQPVASVVVPVYNKEAFLAECLACLETQTLAKDDFEAILVDDGSTDGSLAKCEELAASRPWVRVLSQPNGGVCEARNAGIRAARGRFIFFLDPDDTVSPETLANASAFFETCPDEVDMVTYPIVSIRDGKRQRLHCRYAVLDETGVYDLNDPACAIVAQTTMNVAVRNRFGNNVLFDWRPEAGAVIHEDEKYCTDVLQRTMKLGFCAEAEYRWMRHDEGVTTSSAQPERLYDNNLALYEELFGRYEDEVPPYVQGLLVNDIAWKMNARIALPTHVEGAAYDEALARMGRLLDRVDDRIIMTHPTLKRDYRLFVLGLKKAVPLV